VVKRATAAATTEPDPLRVRAVRSREQPAVMKT
jgi:hypothetical protein